MGQQKKLPDRKLCLNSPCGLKMYENPPTLGFNIRARTGRVPVAGYREWVK